MIAAATTFLFGATLALWAGAMLHRSNLNEIRLQRRLIRALHAEFGSGSGQLFRPRAAFSRSGFMVPRRA